MLVNECIHIFSDNMKAYFKIMQKFSLIRKTRGEDFHVMLLT